MARLQMHVLRRVCSFSNSSSVELLGAAWNRRFSAHALNGVTFSRSSVNDERRIWQVLSRGDVLGRFEAKYCGSGIRTLTSIEGGKEGKEEEKLHHSTKIDGGKKYSVVQIDSDGSWRTVWRNAVELVRTQPFHFVEYGLCAIYSSSQKSSYSCNFHLSCES